MREGDESDPLFTETVIVYAVTFVNYDQSVLQTGKVSYGALPAYAGETPVKPETDEFTYRFDGWEPEIVPVVSDATYQATFFEIVKPVDFISDSDEEVVTAAIEDIKAFDKDSVIIGKDRDGTETLSTWTVEMPTSFFDGTTDAYVSLTMTDVSEDLPADIPEKQKEEIKDMTVISIMMVVGETQTHSFDAPVTVKFAYTPKAGEDTGKLVVYYVNTETSALERYDATYSDGFVTFETDHFSYWAVGEQSSGSNDDGLYLLAMVIIVIAAISAVGVVILRRN